MNLMDMSPVIPVVDVADAEHAVPLAIALAAGGARTIEITLRSPAALSAIERIATEVPDIMVGAGTLLKRQHVADAVRAGARFLVSPGSTPSLVDAMEDTGLRMLPGVATASETMALLERGITHMKFFPAEPAGGLSYLKALAGPLSRARFCATGGISLQLVAQYLALPNVGCVGASWLAPAEALQTGDWVRIKQLATQAVNLGARS